MGWYGGQDGARRLRLRDKLSDSLWRFKAFLGSSITTVDITGTIHDNKDFSVVKILLHNPASQEEIIAKINSEGSVATADDANARLAIAIPFNWHLKSLDGIADDICQSLEGLFLFGTVNINHSSLLAFIKRCPNLKALTLRDYGDAFSYKKDESFPRKLFVSSAAPSLEFFEAFVSSDSTVTAMVSSPNLKTLVMTEPDKRVTNAGFHALVKAGGGKQLHTIHAGTLVKDQSKTLCTETLGAIFGKRRLALTHMPSTLRPLPEDKEPYAVVPLERMSVKQLRAAIEERGMPMSKPALKANYIKDLLNAGFNLKEEAAIQARKHIKYLKGSKPRGYEKKVAELQAIHDAYYAKKNKRQTDRERNTHIADKNSSKKMKASASSSVVHNGDKENICNAKAGLPSM